MAARLLQGPGTVLAALLAAVAVAYISSLEPMAAVVAFGAVVVLILVLTYPLGTLLLLGAAIPWEGMLGYPSETVSAVKLLGLLLVVSALIAALRHDKPLLLPSTSPAVAAFVLLVAVSLIFSPDPGAGTGKVLRYVLFAGFFFLVVQLVESRDALNRLLRVITVSAGAAALYGVAAFVLGATERAGGPIEDPNDFGYLMATVLPLCGYLIVADARRRWLWAGVFPIMLAAMLATLSRSVLVGLIVVAVWAVATGRIRLGGLLASAFAVLAVIGVGFLLWGPLINERIEEKSSIAEKNVDSREALWRGAALMAMDNPVVGVGADRFGDESVDYVRENPILIEDPEAHNSYLEILSENGPFALAAFIAFLAGTWSLLTRAERASAEAGDELGERLGTALKASLLVAIVSGFFLSEQVAVPFWLVGALAGALACIHRQDAEAALRF